MEYAILIFYFLSLSVLFLFGIHSLVLLYYYHKTQKILLPKYELPKELPVVTIQLPIFNELYVVERLIRNVCKIRYPKDKLEIQVLDDSTDETQEIAQKLVEEYRAKGFDIHYLHRGNREGFKAGALKYGLERARGEFIAIFDADFIPAEDFLEKTIPYFQNPQVGMVQTRWGHINEEYSFLTKALALSLDGHFVIEQQARNRAGFFINFNGTAGIWRKQTIIDAGNWQPDTLTEDLDLSYRAQLKGWKFIFLNDVVSPAELPADINALKTQQFRWTKGAVETAKKILPMLLKAKLDWKVKLEGAIHLTSNIVFPLILVVALLNVPLVIIKNTFSNFDVYYNAMSIFVLASISSFLFYLYSQKAIHVDWRNRILLFPVFLAGSMGLAINNTKAVFEALIGKKSGFARTPKYRIVSSNDDWRFKKYVQRRLSPSVIFEIFVALYYFVGIGISIYYLEIAAIPFQLLFLLGFGTVGYMSIKHALVTSK
ncbi:MAG: cellulose synthase family protein [Candidatus Kapaibacteriota bacterium]|jgi:cellulose synthase/poly-beta-1,6-N-acetylglucosamine synthase-like glycosyltransferase